MWKLLLYFGAFVVLGGPAHAAAPLPSTAWREVIEPGEATEFARAADLTNQLQAVIAKQSDGVIRRGFHAKAHAALTGELRVMDGLPEYLRYGIFKEARTYPAMGRFSNGVGGVHGDRRVDLRGFSIKILGGKDPMLLADESEGQTQDFLMINAPAVLARNTKQFMVFAQAALAGGFKVLPILIRELGLSEANRMMLYLTYYGGRLTRSLVQENYWSGGPIKFGPYAAKYMVRATTKGHSFAFFRSKDYLRDDFKSRIKTQDITFDLMVQFFVDEKRTPIEDASVEWTERVTPFIKVAELTFKKRDMDSPEIQAEEDRVNAMAFNPWHCPEDLRPVGNIMRVRKAVYAASMRLRHNAGLNTAGK
jgi:hypothetical protein